MPEEDLARLDALCLIFGIGLILFNAADSARADYEVGVRALRHKPDMFYVNQNLKFVEAELFD